MITTEPAPSEAVQTYKSRRLQPIIYTKLSTSTFMNHQRLKRIKGLLGYSEQFKDNHKEYGSLKYRIKPFKSRDYRMAAELNIEIYEVDYRIKFLERFLKAQRNLRIIRIRILRLERFIPDPLKSLCEVFSTVSRINRIQVDFPKHQIFLVNQSPLERVKATRRFPNLRELAITRDNQEIFRISVPLFKVGFDFDQCGDISVKDHLTIEKLIKKTPKFEKIDTIRLKGERLGDFSAEFLEAIVFVISRLPNIREFSIEFAEHEEQILMKQILKVFDTLLKASVFEVLKCKMGFCTEHLESIVTHPVFKAKSLKRVHLFLFLDSQGAKLIQIMQLLRDIPMLYEVSLHLTFEKPSEKITEEIMEEISKMLNLRKLELLFDSSKLSEKQTGDILHSLCKMSLLEELSLDLHTRRTNFLGDSLALSLGDKELTRLQKVRLCKREYDYSSDKILIEMAEFFGKCRRMREMEFDVDGCSITSWEDVSRRLLESWRKLKHLQELKLNLNTTIDSSNHYKERTDLITVLVFADWMKVFDGMENLQDVYISKFLYYRDDDEHRLHEKLETEALRNPKYRLFEIEN